MASSSKKAIKSEGLRPSSSDWRSKARYKQSRSVIEI
jgi:hypothetical protein